MLETQPTAPTGSGGGGTFKVLVGLLLICGVVAGVWYFTRWHPNFTLAIEARQGQGQGEPITFTYKLKAKDLIRTSAHMDMKMRATAGQNVENISVSLDYKQFTRVVEVLPSGDFLTRTTARFVGGDASSGFDMSAASRALAGMLIEAEIDSYGWVRPGSLVDLGGGDVTGGYDAGGLILRSLPRTPMAPGAVVDVHTVVPLPEKPIQGVAQFAKNQRPSLTGDCLFKCIEVRNGRKLAHLSIQALMMWDGEQTDANMQFKAGVLWKGSCFYDIEAGLVTEVYLSGKIEVFAHVPGQGDMSIVGTIDYFDFSDLNPVGE